MINWACIHIRLSTKAPHSPHVLSLGKITDCTVECIYTQSIYCTCRNYRRDYKTFWNSVRQVYLIKIHRKHNRKVIQFSLSLFFFLLQIVTKIITNCTLHDKYLRFLLFPKMQQFRTLLDHLKACSNATKRALNLNQWYN